MALHKALSDCLDRREQLEQHLQAEYSTFMALNEIVSLSLLPRCTFLNPAIFAWLRHACPHCQGQT